MSSLMCRAIRMPSSSQVALPGGLADVLTDLPQRARRLWNRRCTELEVVNLAGPDPNLSGDTRGRQLARCQLGVVQQHLGARDVNQRAGQPRCDVVERLVDLF